MLTCLDHPRSPAINKIFSNELRLIASCRRQGTTTTSYLSPPSLRNGLLFEHLVRSKLYLFPRVLDVFAFAEPRTNCET